MSNHGESCRMMANPAESWRNIANDDDALIQDSVLKTLQTNLNSSDISLD